MSVIEVRVPDIGDFKDVEVIEVLVKPGEVIKAEQSLITVESDKASMEIPSSQAGTVVELKVKLGDKVAQGDILAIVESAAASVKASAPLPPTQSAPTASIAPSPHAAPASPSPTALPASSDAPREEMVEVKVPDIGDFKDVEVIEVLVKKGQTIQAQASLITVESDKASMEIPSDVAGVISELKVKLGDKVREGSVIALVASAASSAQVEPHSTAGPILPDAPAPRPEISAPAETPESNVPEKPATASVTQPSPPRTPQNAVHAVADGASISPLPHASPSVRKFARELGVDLQHVTGSGTKGRIIPEDVQKFVKTALSTGLSPDTIASVGTNSALPPWPSLDFSKFGATELMPLSRIKKISGPSLARNWAQIPHVSQFDDADITQLEQFRKSTNEALAKSGVRVTILAFVMKACIAALQKFPEFNSSLDAQGANLILKRYFHLGFAADTPHGLVVPVIRDCDQKGIVQIATETAQLALRAREGKLSPSEMQGASFTITSLGGIGGTSFTPIINAPEVAILGLSKSEIKPRWNGKEFVPALTLPLSLAYDHRVIDGAQGARFVTYLSEVLGDMRRVLL